MEQSRKEILEQTALMLGMLPGIQQELRKKYPNVLNVEIGLKRKNNKRSDLICFRVIVEKKVSEYDLKQEEIIPREINGFPIDVLVYRVMAIHGSDDSDTYDLLSGGIQIDAGTGLAGTLGCFVTRDAEPAAHRKVYFLSNHHILAGKDGKVGRRVGQPSFPSNCKCCLCHDVGELFCAEIGTSAGTAATIGTVLTPPGAANALDAGIAKILGQDATDPKTVYFSNSIEGIGPVFGSLKPITLAIKDRVRKRGRTTGVTFGELEAVATTTIVPVDKNDPAAGNIHYDNCTHTVLPLAENPAMSGEGDSGAVYVNRKNQVVALHFAGHYTTTAAGPLQSTGEARCFPIENVMSRLGVSVLSSGTENSIPLSGISEAKIKPIRAGNYVHAFEQRMRSIPQGEVFLQILLDHRNEVMDLINDNREVKFAWHRFNGPEYIGHVLKNASNPTHPVPADINGYSLQNLLIKMGDVLERHGSEKLEKAVDDYSAFAFDFAHQYKGIESLTNALQHFPICPKCGKAIHMNAHAD